MIKSCYQYDPPAPKYRDKDWWPIRSMSCILAGIRNEISVDLPGTPWRRPVFAPGFQLSTILVHVPVLVLYRDDGHHWCRHITCVRARNSRNAQFPAGPVHCTTLVPGYSCTVRGTSKDPPLFIDPFLATSS